MDFRFHHTPLPRPETALTLGKSRIIDDSPAPGNPAAAGSVREKMGRTPFSSRAGEKGVRPNFIAVDG
jgi:hypothetical protein